MANTVELNVDVSAFRDMVRRLTDEEMKKAYRKGFKKSILVMRKGVQKEIQRTTPAHRDHKKTWTRRGYFYGLPLHRDVKFSIFRRAIGANVSLCNPRRKPNRAYILRMLNSGTTYRATKKGLNRGSLRALNFFESGIEMTKDKAISELNENIRKAVMKEVNK